MVVLNFKQSFVKNQDLVQQVLHKIDECDEKLDLFESMVKRKLDFMSGTMQSADENWSRYKKLEIDSLLQNETGQ